MPLTKVTDCRFLNDNASAQRGAREQLKFILANGDKLLRLLNGKKYLMTAKDFQNIKENFLAPRALITICQYRRIKAAN